MHKIKHQINKWKKNCELSLKKKNLTKSTNEIDFLTSNEIYNGERENDHGGNEHKHPVIISNLLVREIKSTRKQIRIGTAFHTYLNRLKPSIDAKRSSSIATRKHDFQTDNSGHGDCEHDDGNGSHRHGPLKLAPRLVFFSEALVLALRHERLAKRVADDRH